MDAQMHQYNQQRISQCQDKPICLAPFVNLYFKSIGDVAPCWRYRPQVQETTNYPKQTITKIWQSTELNELRESLQKNIFPESCQECAKNIAQNEFKTYLGSHYDTTYILDGYPKIMEFELSNTCDLECIMCNGNLSSMIRKNKEKKAPLPARYNEAFVEQLVPFIPQLEIVRFNGGEPFLIDIYYKIWLKIIKIKPTIQIDIATNGTVLGSRARKLLEQGRFNINLSLDSLQKENYEHIRKNAKYAVTMRNMEFLIEYCKRKKTHFLIVINPMRMNWQEMPDFVRLGIERDIPIAFNTVLQPQELSLATLDKDKLTQVYEQLLKETFPLPENPTMFQKYNIEIYLNLVQVQIKNWLNEKSI
jgi:radical SAM protein with 4Fe4S-binding SPASM domain